MDKISLVYLCGGMSSRFGGQIKQFAKVGPNDETLIQVSLDQALKQPFHEIVFIVSSKTQVPFMELFGDSYKNVPIKYCKQEYDIFLRDRPWGTADAFSYLKKYINNSFIICNGDDLYGETTFKLCFERLLNEKCNIAMSYPLHTLLPETGKVNRGVFTVDFDNRIVGIDELLDISSDMLDETQLGLNASVNFMGLNKNVIDLVYDENVKFIDKYTGDRKIEHLLPLALNDLIQDNKMEMFCMTSPDKCIGVTKQEDVEYVRSMLK